MAIGVDDGWSAADPTKNVYSTATPYNSPQLFGEAPNPEGWVNLRAAEETATYNNQVAALTQFFADEATARAGREAALNSSAAAAGVTVTAAAIAAAAGGGGGANNGAASQSGAGLFSTPGAGLFSSTPGAPLAAPKPLTLAAVLAALWWLL